jgi:hypothetical protein
MRCNIGKMALAKKQGCHEAAKCTMVLTRKASTNNNQAAGRMQDSTAANMAVTVLIGDTRRQETTSTMQHRAVAKRSTELVILGNKALAPTIPS